MKKIRLGVKKNMLQGFCFSNKVYIFAVLKETS